MKTFDGKVAFITGAAHGQGRATALALAKEGAAIAAFDVATKKDRSLSDLFRLAPQTVIPLIGEMSRSDKRVIARYEQLEPVDGVTVQQSYNLN